MPARHRRRGVHRGAWGSALALLVAASALIAWSASRDPADPGATATTSAPPSTATTTSVAVTTTAPAPATTAPPRARIQNPFTTPAARAFLAGVTGNLTAGVYDLTSHLTYLYRPGIPEYTASLVKIDILATLLHEAQVAGHPLSARQQRFATSMIEASSNPAASVLWAQAGGRDAVAAFDQAVGMTQTIPSWTWGAIATTPRDQLRLLRVITQPNALLGPAARAYEGSLMAQVVGFERFGVGWGVRAGAVVEMKDGWYHEPRVGWQVNSAGLVREGARAYLVAMMINRGPSEGADMTTLTTLAHLIDQGLRP